MVNIFFKRTNVKQYQKYYKTNLKDIFQPIFISIRFKPPVIGNFGLNDFEQ